LKKDGESLTGFFNNQPYHAPPVALNMISNALLYGNDKNVSIDVTNYPLPQTALDEIDNIGNSMSSGFNIGFTISFGYIFFTVKGST